MRPGITGPATLKYRLEDEMLASLRLSPEGKSVTDWQGKVYDISKSFPLGGRFRGGYYLVQRHCDLPG